MLVHFDATRDLNEEALESAFLFAAVVSVGGALGPATVAWGWYVISPSTAQGMTNIQFLPGRSLKDTIVLSIVSIALAMVLEHLSSHCRVLQPTERHRQSTSPTWNWFERSLCWS